VRLFGNGLLLLLLCLALACGKKPKVGIPAETQRGLASWYGKGDGYQGKLTASGEPFDRNGLTAAHYDLPFGTQVEVTNELNGKTVVVRINDRFPVETLRKGRVIDLSYKAAQLLDIIRDGVVPVSLRIISVP
jgi:rare lipoprotein A